MTHLFAAPHAAAAAAPVGAGGLASVTVALLIVLGAIFAVAWLARRVRRGMGNRVGNAIDVLAEMPLGPKERAVLLKVGAEQILIGVAPGRVSALHVLREPVQITKPAAPALPAAATFGALLKRSLGK